MSGFYSEGNEMTLQCFGQTGAMIHLIILTQNEQTKSSSKNPGHSDKPIQIVTSRKLKGGNPEVRLKMVKAPCALRAGQELQRFSLWKADPARSW